MKRLLIANRGEIACRVIRTCQRLGIESVVVSSDVDASSIAMQQADYGVVIGGAEAKDSYLNIDKIIEVAKRFKVDAIHPGYGFLSENADFAQAVRKAGFVFVGPSSDAIQLMGSKSQAKAIAKKANVPIIQGYMGDDQSLNNLQKEATEIGYPVLIKATFGGGGKGMRCVLSPNELELALAACQREALNSFANAHVMLEKYIANPRHIEVQVFGDQHGNILALSERDCSLQRRHQKIIEEAPACGLSEKIKQDLAKAAVSIAKAVNYEGAGTVEFLVDDQENFYFLEMNTRLQVEHPVTEEILGLDLVEWQLRVAFGEELPLPQEEIHPYGHCVEARLYAEDTDHGFLPSTGLLTRFSLPRTEEFENVRIDSGYQENDSVTVYYDPMLAKIIAWGESRKEAFQTLKKALQSININGVKTNINFLIDLTHASEVCENHPDVGYIDRLVATNLKNQEPPTEAYVLAAIWLHQKSISCAQSPWDLTDGWRINDQAYVIYSFDGHDIKIYPLTKDSYGFSVKDEKQTYLSVRWTQNSIWALKNGFSLKASIQHQEGKISIQLRGHSYDLALSDVDHAANFEDSASHLNAPMPGRVISVMVQAGEKVEAGSPLLILEAMKMEHTIRAPFNGTVDSIHFDSGDFVEEGVELAKMTAAEIEKKHANS